MQISGDSALFYYKGLEQKNFFSSSALTEDKFKLSLVYSNNIDPSPNDIKFYEWLAGLIDGDGYFYISKPKVVFLKITMDERDIDCLQLINSKLGGNIYPVPGKKAIKYVLTRKAEIFKLICSINGLIRNPIRIDQLKPIYLKYNLIMLKPKNLTFNNGWLSGFIDSDGSISMNLTHFSLTFSITQKHKDLFEVLRACGEMRNLWRQAVAYYFYSR